MKMFQSLNDIVPQTDTTISDAKNTGLNQAQIHFLQVLSHIKTDKAFVDLKRLVRDFYAQQLQKEADKCWEEGKINDHLLNEHLRTPYK
jgi:hypothetical protein